MQMKMLTTAPHWIDRSLFTNQILDEQAQKEKVGIIINNLHNYLASGNYIDAESQYSLVVNLFICADNPHFYHLVADISVFSKEFLLVRNRDFAPEKLLLEGELDDRISDASTSTQHTPPPGPPPPAPLVYTGFFTIGDEFNLVQNIISIPSGFAQGLAKLNEF
jgi:hypothetical protein